MSDDRIRKRRSSFFPKPIEEITENHLELFHNMKWVDEEKENIISESFLFGNQGKKTLKEYVEKLKCRKQEYQKLVSNKQEEQVHLKEKLRKNKVEIDWETACGGLTDLERDIAYNIPDYKCLVEKVQLLALKTALVKRTNRNLHVILNTYNRCANEEIQKLQERFVDKIVEDSGVGTSYNDSDINLSTIEMSEDE